MGRRIFPGWYQVVLVILCQAASTGAVFASFSLIAVPLQGTFDTSMAVVMMAMTVTVLVAGSANPVFGPAMDKYSLRGLMLIGSVLMVTGFILLSFVASMAQAVLVYGLFLAIGSVLLGPLAASALLARWFSRRLGLVMGIASSGTALGGLFFPPIIQGLIDAYEWRTAMQILSAGLAVILIPAIILLGINRPEDRNLITDGDQQPEGGVVKNRDDFRKIGSTGEIIRNANFWLIAAIMGLIFAGSTAMTSNLLPIAISKGFSAENGAFLISIWSAANFCGKALFATIGDKVSLRLIVFVALLLQMLGMLVYASADNYGTVFAASLMIGLAVGGMLPLRGLLLARVYGPKNIGRVMGLMAFVIMFGNLVSPVIFGLIFDRTGNYDNALIGYACLLLIAVVLLKKVQMGQNIQSEKAIPKAEEASS